MTAAATLAMCLSVGGAAFGADCGGDFDADHDVDTDDLLTLLSEWSSGQWCTASNIM